MKIELKEPFKSDWKSGYLITNKENRRNLVLFNSSKDRTTVSYARYLMSVKMKRYLTKDEHVDHIDNNKKNDSIDNLQILTLAENNRKSSKGRKYVTLNCPICKKDFTIPKSQNWGKGRVRTCSRRCGGIKSKMTNRYNKYS